MEKEGRRKASFSGKERFPSPPRGERLATRRPNAEREVATRETERERERENPRPFTGSGGGGGGGVVSWPPWRAALSTYSYPRLASSPPPPCLPRHPYLPTFLPLLLHLVCAAATTEVARGSRWKPVTKESFDRRSSPSRGIYRGNVGKGYLTSHVCNHSDKRFEIMLLSFRSVQSLTLSRSFSFFLFFFMYWE